MPPNHHHFVLQFRIGPWYFGNGVESVLVVTGELYVDIQFDIHRDIGFEQPVDPPIVLNRHYYNGKWQSVLPLVDEPSQAAAAVDKNGSSGASVIPSIPAGENDRQRVLRGKKLGDLVAQL